MAHRNVSEAPDLAAGDFSSWLAEVEGAIRGDRASDVPCGGCTACCTSHQFVHIRPDETDTLSLIPAQLLFRAPGLPEGHVVLGYDERGHCPMLVDGGCSIYDHRPETCRTYDCRIFPATGLEPDGGDKALIAERARRWRFTFPSESDSIRYEAVRAAATFLGEQASALRDGAVPTSSTQLAVLAIELHDTFLRHDAASGQPVVVDPDPQTVRVEITRRTGLAGRSRRAPPGDHNEAR